MKTVLLVSQIVIALLITVSVLLQAQGGGLGSMWGGGGETYHTRRGLEKVLFYLTIGAGVLFTAISLAIVTV